MAYRKLGRDNKHRRSMLASLTKQLILNESITTTETRAKEVRKCFDKLVTYGKKNTLVTRAAKELGIEGIAEYLNGPVSMAFGYEDVTAPARILNDFAKDHKKLELKAGLVEGEVVSLDTIKEYASIPSMEGLLTMFAGGLIEHVKNLSIALNLYAEQLGEEN